MANIKPPVTTNETGTPVASDDYSLTTGADGPKILQNH